MSPTRKPSAVTGLQRAVAAPARDLTVRSDDSIGRPEDIGSLVPPAGPPPRPEKLIRFTIDLDPALHQDLKEYAVQTRVSAAQVVRVMLAELLHDDRDLADRIRARIWAAGK